MANQVQVIARAHHVPVGLVDLSHLSSADREAAARSRASAEARGPFNLEKGPLLRATLLRLGLRDHILLLALHHIITDAWSMGVLFRELTAAYAAESSGRSGADVLPALPLQYTDYAVWQREWSSGDRLARTLAYWSAQLEGLPRLELPTDRPRPALKSGRGASLTFTVAPGVSAGLQTLARREGATLFMTLLAGFAVLLGRYSGQTDVAIGSPVANRTRTELEHLIGFFVNTLVLRVSLADAPSFRALVGRVKEVALAAFAHQDLPFERLVEALQPRRDLSRNPLFQVMFQHQSSVGGELPGSIESNMEIERTVSVFDLEFNLWESRKGLEGMVDYSTDLFDVSTIERMAGHYVTLLAAAIENPDQPITTLPLMAADERHQMLVGWNATDAPVPDATLHALVDAQAARTPDAIAVQAGAQTLTYSALVRRANQLAHLLSARGVGRQSVVAICLERSLELVVALLGVLKAGAAYLPIEPTAPAARTAAVVAHADVALILTSTTLRDGLPVAGPSCLCVDRMDGELAAAPHTPPALASDSDELAYIIYTSGSTGAPKGVEVTHRSVVNLWAALNDRVYRSGQTLKVTVNGSVAFDTSVKQLIQLLNGHSLHLVPEDIRGDGEAMLRFIQAGGIDVIDCTPSQLGLLIDAGLLDDQARRVILVGGEALDERHWFALANAPHLTAFNMYGPTECTGDATACRIDSSLAPNTIGKPLANTEAYVLDTLGQPVPVGVPGELHLGGVGLARGYRGDAELTAARFRSHPFRAAPARLYATGDRVRHRADGQLEFLGRLDAQIKLHGFRIEPAEIEAALRRHSSIADARVVRREDVPGSPRLVAYLVAGNGAAPTADEVTASLRACLPRYMVPSAYVWVPRYPLTDRGKIDFASLPGPDMARPDLSTAFVAARTADETVIASIWQELLAVDHVGVDDDFFADLGGHSLLATRVISRVRKLLGVELPLRLMFTAPTVAGLAAALELHRPNGASESSPVLRPVSRELFRVRRGATGCLALPEPLRSRLSNTLSRSDEPT